MTPKLTRLCEALTKTLGDSARVTEALGEVTLQLPIADYFETMGKLRDFAEFSFEELVDLCGVDYSTYKNGEWSNKRFAVVVHLLSLRHNWRLRVRVFAEDSDFPVVASVTPIWKNADWFEREAFDLFGIAFLGHQDLRRILTDYGFVGHPFRKDFPVSGNVEMRYDPEVARVVYQPVTIEPRENTPRIVREDGFGD